MLCHTLHMAIFCLVSCFIKGLQSNEAFYRRWTHTCWINTPLFTNTSVIFQEECAAVCLSLLTKNCTKWIWDKAKNECHFNGESADVYSLWTSKTSALELLVETNRDCSDGYNYDVKTRTCFKVIMKRTTWKKARKHCMEDGGDLISLPTKDKWDLVINNIKCGAGPYWLGLRWGGWLTGQSFVNVFGDNVFAGLNNYDGNYKWIDNEVDCANVRKKPWNDYPSAMHIWDESCNYRTYSYICEINV